MKIKILVVPSDSVGGVGKFRSIDPHTYLQNKHSDEYHVDINFNPPNDDEFYKKYNIIHFHSFLQRGVDIESTADLTIQRLQWCKKHDVITICDIDDYWMVDQYHPMFTLIKNRKDNELKVKVLKNADWVTTTTPVFADIIRSKLGVNNIIVIPNAINEEEEQFKPKLESSEFVRFGWLGGASHKYDIELMVDGISSAHYSYKNKIQFVLCGFDLRGEVREVDKATGKMKTRPIKPEETPWYDYEKAFTDNYKVLSSYYTQYLQKYTKDEQFNDVNEPYRRVWTRPVNTYAENYNKFDISLAPLKDTLFNSSKSQMKVIEAGFHKKPLIASAFGPYLIDLKSSIEFGGKINPHGNALLVDTNKNHKQWATYIKKLMESPAMREDLGNNLYETVKDKYSLKHVSKIRNHFYKSLIDVNIKV